MLAVLPVLGSLVMLALLTGVPGRGSPPGYLLGGVLVVATLALPMGQAVGRRSRRRARVVEQRVAYLTELDALRERLRSLLASSASEAERRHPPPAGLAQLLHVGPGPPRFEVRARDPGFLVVRYAVGRTESPFVLVAAPPPGRGVVDPVAATASRRMLEAPRPVVAVPVVWVLRHGECLEVCGPADRARAAVRAVLVSAVVTHRPDDLVVVVLAAPDVLSQWAWTRWLPHARPLDRVRDGSTVLVVCDGVTLPDQRGSRPGTVLLMVPDAASETGGGERDLTVAWRRCGDPEPFPGVSDECDLPSAEQVARRLAGRYAAARDVSADDETLASFEPSWWRARSDADALRAPIGHDASGALVELDLKEAAGGGVGPHGLLVGATGSGKSELLRTLVLGLAASNGPERLNLVLIDFKGGATFADLAPLPHVSALITNLADDAVLVERARDALEGELVRRQLLLRAAGAASVRDLSDATHARSDGDAPSLPALLIVVDEFSEVLADHPDLAEVFVRIGRLGRSLGMHLLLSTQRLEAGRIHGLEAHLSYRIALRTFTAEESRAVIGVPDAHDLPSRPGAGLLRSGPGALMPFTAAYVGSPAPRTPTFEPDGRSVLEVAVSAMTDARVAPARRIWLPPLVRSPTLGELAVRAGPGDATARPSSPLKVTVGLVDRPREQRYEDLVVDLARGHLAIVGGPGSGRSTLVASIVAALALGAPAGQVEVFGLDFGGHLLQSLAGLPQVTAVGTPQTPELVQRILTELTRLVDAREELARSGRAPPRHVVPAVLVVDGWPRLCREQEDVAERLVRLVDRGLGSGLHLVLTAGRWIDLRGALRELCTARMELRLAEPLDSELDRRAAARVPRLPGHGLDAGGGHFVAVLPVLGERSTPGRLEEDIADLVDRVRGRWVGPDRPALPVLPTRVDLAEVRELARVRQLDGLLVGLEEQRLDPVALLLDQDPHLLVLGEARSGKTSLLRSLLTQVGVLANGRAAVVLVDPRRSLRPEMVRPSRLLDHLSTPARTEEALRRLAGELTRRLEDGETAAIRDGSAAICDGSVFVVVDDYDLVATEVSSPLLPLVPLLPRAREVGLQLVVARRTGGAFRALHDPVLRMLGDLAAPALLLSGRPEDGPLLGGLRPYPAPPGRGRLLTRAHGVQVVQTAWLPPTEPPPGEGPGQDGRRSATS